MRIRPSSWLIPFAIGATLGATRVADARSCTVPTDCPRGFTCVMSAGTTGACAASTCQTDADCAAGFRCYRDISGRCTADGACTGASYCAPQWFVPCETDGDCGPGFTCSGKETSTSCGPGLDAGFVYPYGTTTTIPCEDAPKPIVIPDSSFAIPDLCQPGEVCISNVLLACRSTAPTSCQVDSDCPVTWTCACQSSEVPAGPSTDAACPRMACRAPNSDLEVTGGEGFGPATSGEGVAPAVPGDAGSANAAGGATASSNSQGGGCSMGGGGGGGAGHGLWLSAGAGIIAAFRRRSRQRPSRTRLFGVY